MINRHLAHLWRQMKIHRILTHVCLHQIVCLCVCCYAKTSSSAVQKRHSKVYGNQIAPLLLLNSPWYTPTLSPLHFAFFPVHYASFPSNYYILRFFLTFAPFPYPLHFAIFPFLYNERPSTPSYIVRPSPFFPFLLHCASFHSPTTIYHGHIAI